MYLWYPSKAQRKLIFQFPKHRKIQKVILNGQFKLKTFLKRLQVIFQCPKHRKVSKLRIQTQNTIQHFLKAYSEFSMPTHASLIKCIRKTYSTVNCTSRCNQMGEKNDNVHHFKMLNSAFVCKFDVKLHFELSLCFWRWNGIRKHFLKS